MPGRVTLRQVALLLAIVGLGWAVGQIGRLLTPVGSPVGNSAAAQAAALGDPSVTHEVANPTLTLVVFTDYQCPACKLSEPNMDAAVRADGHVRVVYRQWPVFGERSMRAARVALASARQGIFLRVHAALMANRQPVTDQVLRRAVEASGGSWPRIIGDLSEHRASIDNSIDSARRDALALELSGTPSYLAGSLLVEGAQSRRRFERAFGRARSLRDP